MSWPRDGTQPHPLDCCETGLDSDDVSITGYISDQDGKFSTGLYTELKFCKMHCNDRGHDLYNHFGRLPECYTTGVMSDNCCKLVSLLVVCINLLSLFREGVPH